MDAVKYLVAEHGVDPKRVGLYGGSYGGFITLMAMFTEPTSSPDALRPVTDWAHYNHGYTSNISTRCKATPKPTSEVRRSISRKGCVRAADADGIGRRKRPFPGHGESWSQRLIELRKENWELAAIWVEDHGFERAELADEYKRILKLLKRICEQNEIGLIGI